MDQLTIGDPLVAQFPCHTCSLGKKSEIAEEMRSLSALQSRADHTLSVGVDGKRRH